MRGATSERESDGSYLESNGSKLLTPNNAPLNKKEIVKEVLSIAEGL
jgi:hypothetical protein